MRAALLQLASSEEPLDNLRQMQALLHEAKAEGAGFALTPEVCNCVTPSRAHQREVLALEAEDRVLAGLRDTAAALGLWLSIGSLALKTEDPDGRFANRGFVITPQGEIAARYDKIHMFDVDVSATETYRESSGYRPGDRLARVETPFGTLGLSICYDLRFPHLYRDLALSGADILLVPAAFSAVTGAAHWEPLLRARAIENGAWVLAAAQSGYHPSQIAIERPRQSYGHSFAVTPWGEVALDMGKSLGVGYVDLDPNASAAARGRIPSLFHGRPYERP